MVAKISFSFTAKPKRKRRPAKRPNNGTIQPNKKNDTDSFRKDGVNRRTFGLFLGCVSVLIAFCIFYQMTFEPDRQLYIHAIPFMTFWKRLRQRRTTPVPFCAGLLKNNTSAINKAGKYMKEHRVKFKRIPTVNYVHIEGDINCERFRLSSGYALRPASEEEAKFPLAYSIMMYRDVEQVERLLRSIFAPQNYYCIHVDKKSPKIIHTAMTRIAQCFSNVFIAKNLVNVRWGMFSILQADLSCMNDLLRYRDWRYFINLTGQEFPLVSNREIVEDFKKLNNTNLIHSWRERSREFISRTKYKWINNRKTKLRKGKPPYNITIMKGSLHNFLTRDFVYYVINSGVSRQFLWWLKDTWAPEETFFASIQYNQHLRAPGCNPASSPRGPIAFNFRYKLWRGGQNVCAGKWVRDICVAGVGDLHKAVSSKGLFINKLHLNFQPLALSCLEEYQRNLTMKTISQSSRTTVNRIPVTPAMPAPS